MSRSKNGNHEAASLQDLLSSPSQTDELAAGHYGRVRHLKEIGHSQHGLSGKRDARDYIKSHSTIAFHKCLAPDLRADFRSASRADILSYRAFRIPYRHAHFCAECVRLDREQAGYAIWRRSHHLPGLDACLRHGIALHRLRSHCSLPLQPPTGSKGWHFVISAHQDALDIERQSETVKRYEGISLELVMQDRPLRARVLIPTLQDMARKAGIRATWENFSTRGTYLSDAAMEVFPRTWLFRTFPRLRQKASGEVSGLLDLMLLGRHIHCGGQHLAAALTVLCPSLPEALTILASNS